MKRDVVSCKMIHENNAICDLALLYIYMFIYIYIHIFCHYWYGMTGYGIMQVRLLIYMHP